MSRLVLFFKFKVKIMEVKDPIQYFYSYII